MESSNINLIQKVSISVLVVIVVSAVGCGSDGSSGAGGDDRHTYPTQTTGDLGGGDEGESDDEVVLDDQGNADPGESLEGTYIVGRVIANLSGGGNLSLECYRFHGDSVELRHNGGLSDVGNYSGDINGGEILWDSGNVSAVEYDGTDYYINSVRAQVARSADCP